MTPSETLEKIEPTWATDVSCQGEQLLWSANFVAGLLAAATLHPVARSRHTKHLLQGLHGFHALQSPKASKIQR